MMSFKIQVAIIATSNTPLLLLLAIHNNSNLDTKSHLSTEIVSFKIMMELPIYCLLSQFGKCNAAIFRIGHTAMHLDEVLRFVNNAQLFTTINLVNYVSSD